MPPPVGDYIEEHVGSTNYPVEGALSPAEQIQLDLDVPAPDHHQTAAFQQPCQRAWCKVEEMPGDIQMKPARPENPRLYAPRIGHSDNKETVIAQPRQQSLEQLTWRADMFQAMPQGYEVERTYGVLDPLHYRQP